MSPPSTKNRIRRLLVGAFVIPTVAAQFCRVLGLSFLSAKTASAAAGDKKAAPRDSGRKVSWLGFLGLDHLAIVVPSTEEALKVWRDRMGLRVVCSEVVNAGTVRLTHLDLGNTQLQLVEPLAPGHPLHAWLAKNGPGLHHFCFKVADVAASHAELLAAGLAPATPPPHQGTKGKRALFLAKTPTQDVQVEITGA
jgi:methylmalonyl-CoA/ethylmalonyl-CoA epimerase